MVELTLWISEVELTFWIGRLNQLGTYSWWSLSFLLGDGVGVPVVYEVVVFGIDTPLQMCTFSYW